MYVALSRSYIQFEIKTVMYYVSARMQIVLDTYNLGTVNLCGM